MKRFFDPSARPCMTGRYRQAEAQPVRERKLTFEQKSSLESWGLPNEEFIYGIRFEDCVDPSIPPGFVRIDGKLVRWPEVVFIPEGES